MGDEHKETRYLISYIDEDPWGIRTVDTIYDGTADELNKYVENLAEAGCYGIDTRVIAEG